MKRILLIFLVAILVDAGCTSRVDCVKADAFCAGLVMDIGSTAGDLNQQAWLGLQEAERDGLVDQIDYVETNDSRDRTRNISVFADRGYDLIVTVGVSAAAATSAAAQRYPQIFFVGVDQEQGTAFSNLVGLVFHEEHGGFLAGVLAASVTQTHQVAALCEEKFVDQMRRYCEGFQAGVQYANPEVNVTVVYREGSTENLFRDSAWGQATALNLIDEGADVLFAAGGETADGALLAAAGENTYVIGADTDRYRDSPEIRPMVLSSAVKQVTPSVYELIQMAAEGQYPSGNFFGAMTMAPFHDLQEQVPNDVLGRITEIQSDLADGTLSTGVVFDLP